MESYLPTSDRHAASWIFSDGPSKQLGVVKLRYNALKLFFYNVAILRQRACFRQRLSFAAVSQAVHSASTSVHISHLCNIIARNVGILQKLRYFIPTYVLKILYHSLILSHLQYCTLLWANSYRSHLHKLRLLQKKAIRIISNTDYLAHSSKLFLNLKLLKLDVLY